MTLWMERSQEEGLSALDTDRSACQPFFLNPPTAVSCPPFLDAEDTMSKP